MTKAELAAAVRSAELLWRLKLPPLWLWRGALAGTVVVVLSELRVNACLESGSWAVLQHLLCLLAGPLVALTLSSLRLLAVQRPCSAAVLTPW